MNLRLLCTPLSLLLPLCGYASGFEVSQQSAVAGGTGHASTARSEDAAAAWFNPAALTDGQGLRIAVGATVAISSLQAQAAESAPDAPWTADTTHGPAVPPHLYASYALGDAAFGLSINAA